MMSLRVPRITDRTDSRMVVATDHSREPEMDAGLTCFPGCQERQVLVRSFWEVRQGWEAGSNETQPCRLSTP